MDESPTNTPAAASEVVPSKREHHPKATPQPTSEQIMIAQLIGGDTKSDDPNQRQKIQKVFNKITFQKYFISPIINKIIIPFYKENIFAWSVRSQIQAATTSDHVR